MFGDSISRARKEESYDAPDGYEEEDYGDYDGILDGEDVILMTLGDLEIGAGTYLDVMVMAS